MLDVMIMAVLIPTLSIGNWEKFFNDWRQNLAELMHGGVLGVRRACP
jgi:hypothetical protein